LSERISFYIDGYNLYNGIRDAFGKKWLWLDLGGLCADIAKPGQVIEKIHYCTAQMKSNPGSRSRQDAYLGALQSVPNYRRHLGRFQDNPRFCRCGHLVGRYSEKQTDTRVASLMVADAMANRTDVLALIGGDEDFVPPIQTIRQECPDKVVVVCLPPNRKCGKLTKINRKPSVDISEQMLRSNQLPKTVRVKGKDFSRPTEWA
tara:strand:+ start:1361 stop:1972 length:612 start_codon:yes stop_codon:yes gene_type:complete